MISFIFTSLLNEQYRGQLFGFSFHGPYHPWCKAGSAAWIKSSSFFFTLSNRTYQDHEVDKKLDRNFCRKPIISQEVSWRLKETCRKRCLLRSDPCPSWKVNSKILINILWTYLNKCTLGYGFGSGCLPQFGRGSSKSSQPGSPVSNFQ